MKIIVDANVVISAAIVDGKTREILLLADATFLAPPELEDEVRSYATLIGDKSGLSLAAVTDILDSLFAAIGTVPHSIPSTAIRKARTAIGDIDPDDVPYLATVIAVERAVVWSDDAVFADQKYVQWYTTQEIIEMYDNGML